MLYELVRGVSGLGQLLTPNLPIFALTLGSLSFWKRARARLTRPLHHRALPRWSRCRLRAVLYELVRGVSRLGQLLTPKLPIFALALGSLSFRKRASAVEPLSAACRTSWSVESPAAGRCSRPSCPSSCWPSARQPVVLEAGLGRAWQARFTTAPCRGGAVVSCVPCCTSWSVESPAFGQLLTPKLLIVALTLGSLSFWKRARLRCPLHYPALRRWSRCQLRPGLYELVRGVSGLGQLLTPKLPFSR